MRCPIVMVLVLAPGCGQSPASPRAQADSAPNPSGTTYPVGAQPRAVATGDLDDDGDLDIVVAESGAMRAAILLNDGHGLFVAGAMPAAGREPSDVRAIDLDRDRDLDLVLANHETSRVTLLQNDGRAGFTTAPGSPLETGSRPHVHGVVAADLDGDAFVDLALDSADDDSVRVLFGHASGFAP